MPSLVVPQDRVVPDIAPGNYLDYLNADDTSLTGGSPVSYLTSHSYPDQDAGQVGIPEGLSAHEMSKESSCNWETFFSKPRAAASPSVATADELRLPRRRAQQACTPHPDGKSGNVRNAPLFYQSTVVDGQRSVSDPIPPSHVFSPSGTAEASRCDLSNVPRSFSTQGLATSYDHLTDEFPGSPCGLNSNQQLPADSWQPKDAPQDSPSSYHNQLVANQANTFEDDMVQYALDNNLVDEVIKNNNDDLDQLDLSNNIPLPVPSVSSCRQARQSPKGLEPTSQYSGEDSVIPGLDVSEWAPPYGQDVCCGSEPQQNFSLQEGASRKRGRKELCPLAEEEDGHLLTKYQDPSPTGFGFDQGPRIETRRPSQALPWNDSDLEDLPRFKRRRLGNGKSSFDDNISQEHEDGPSAINGHLTDPSSRLGSSPHSQMSLLLTYSDLTHGNPASFTIPSAARDSRVNLRPKNSSRAAKKRISRSVKQRSHGDLVLQPDGTCLFREYGKDNWGK